MAELETPPAEPTEGISLDELRLAARNHALPLEALRHPVTPVGLHYVLIHYDIPAVDPTTWRLAVDGEVARSLSLTLDELQALPAVEVVSTMECAGNGRALLSPRRSASRGCWRPSGLVAGAASPCGRCWSVRVCMRAQSRSSRPASIAGSRTRSTSATSAL